MGNQLSAAWVVVQAAESLAISNSQEERRAGKALRCCEVTSLKKVTREEQEGGLKVSLRFYDNNDLKIVKKYRSRVANRIASTFGLQSGDVQIHLGLISSLKFSNPDSRIRTSRPPTAGWKWSTTGLPSEQYRTEKNQERGRQVGSEALRKT